LGKKLLFNFNFIDGDRSCPLYHKKNVGTYKKKIRFGMMMMMRMMRMMMMMNGSGLTHPSKTNGDDGSARYQFRD
jgi:hypothetical protein